MKADPAKQDGIFMISSKIKDNFKYITFNNKYDNQPLTFAYNTTEKVCFNINLCDEILHAIPVKYQEFIDDNENFIYD